MNRILSYILALAVTLISFNLSATTVIDSTLAIATSQQGEDTFVVGQSVADGAVSIICQPENYYLVTLDMTKGLSPQEIGASYASCVNSLPLQYAKRASTYITMITKGAKLTTEQIAERVEDFKPVIDTECRELIEGFASQITSPDLDPVLLMYMANLVPDAIRPTSCSAYGVMPPMSETGKTLVHRTLDWPDIVLPDMPKGRQGLMAPMQSITKIVYPHKTLYLFGELGVFTCITAIDATNRLMVGILDSEVRGAYSNKGKRAYALDLFTALKNAETSDQIATALTDPTRNYAYNHNIVVADRNEVRVIENNVSGKGSAPVRGLRSWNSKLGSQIPAWETPYTIGVVNCFMLDGQADNFALDGEKSTNPPRWEQQRAETKRILSTKKKLSMEDIRVIQCTCDPSKPINMQNVYRNTTHQMIEYIPADNTVYIYFKPFDGSVPTDPEKRFFRLDI